MKFNTKLQEKNTDTVLRNGEVAGDTSSHVILGHVANIDTLKERLRKKIEACRVKRSKVVDPSGESRRRKTTPPKRIVDDKEPSSISYGNLFLNQDTLGMKLNKASKLRGKANLQNLLVKVEKSKRRMEELKKSNAGEEMVRQIELSNALEKAAGGRVMDDPSMIRKALKRRQKAKKKSVKQWQSRIAKTNAQKKEQTRKTTSKPSRAGFEGVGTFLNAQK